MKIDSGRFIPFLKESAVNAAIAAVYVATAKLGFLLAIDPGNVCAVWFPSGIALVALLFAGNQFWPGIWLGSFIANSWFFIEHNPFAWSSLWLSFCIATGSTNQAALGSYLIQKIIGRRSLLDRARSVLMFVGIEAAVCTIAASIGIATLVHGGFLPWSHAPYAWLTWWIGDLVGVLLIAPLFLSGRYLTPISWAGSRVLEAVVLTAATLGTSIVVFGGVLKVGAAYYPIAFVLMAHIFWAAFRFGPFSVSFCCLLISACAVVGTMHELGPFSKGEFRESLLFLQAFVGFLSAMGLSLAAAITEQRQSETRLQTEVDWRRRTQEDLQKAKEQAEEANEAKSRFLAKISHELRTPLNAIIGMADILSETRLDAEQRKFLQTLTKASGTLMDQINDLLDLAKIEAGKMEVQKIVFNLEEIVAMVCEIAAIRASRKQLELVADIKPDVPCMLIGDPGCLRHILLNLVGNAVKYTDRGEVIVTVEKDPGGNSNCLRFMVADTGLGIPADKQDKIFEAFTQASTLAAGYRGGSGLGLTIARHLVGLLGGRIWFESREGQGSRFFFSAVFEKPQQGDDDAAAAPGLAGRRLLLVEDHAATQAVIGEMLKPCGAQVTSVAGAREALGKLQEAQQEGRRYDILLVDGSLPDYSWLQFVAKLEAMRDTVGTTIMMLTALDRAAEMMGSQRLNILAYVIKPVRRSELWNALSSAGQKLAMPAVEPPPAVGPVPAASSPQILLAEDAEDNRLVVLTYLKNLSCRIDIAQDGRAALAMFKSGNYGLILMDMQMPEMDGYEATVAIRQWEKEHGRPPVPIIALTAYALNEEIRRCLDAGCNLHLAKPIKKSVLLPAVLAHIGSPALLAAGSQDDREGDGVDVEIRDLIPIFLTNRRADIGQMRSALSRKDFLLIEHTGHKIKGVSGSYGFDSLGQIGAALEKAAAAKSAQAVERHLVEMEHWFERLGPLRESH